MSTAIIIFREILEISLIIGVLLAASRGVRFRSRLIGIGILFGCLGALLVAYFADVITNAAQGIGQELFNALVLLLAALLIGWTIVWMKRHGRALTDQFKQIGRSVAQGEKPLYTLSIVAMLAVLREGSEVVLFMHGILATGVAPAGVLAGCVIGLMFGLFAGAVIYYGLIKISPKNIFSVTSWFLIFLAAGMVAQASGYLSAAGLIPEIVSPLWDSSRILPEQNWIGQILHALFGYCERPSGIQFIVYVLTTGTMVMIIKLFGNTKSQPAGPKKPTIKIVIILLFALMAGIDREALAAYKIYSPIVSQGELEVEVKGNHDFDKRDEKDGAIEQTYSLGYGFTDWWFAEVEAEIEREAHEDAELEAISFENTFQLSEPGDWFFDTGLFAAYEFGTGDDSHDKIEGKLLLEKQLGDFVHIVNLTLENKIGDGEEEGDNSALEGGVSVGSRYRFREWFEPGLEWYSDIKELGEGKSFEEQDHQLGPVVYGKIGSHIKYDVGYLFGISDAAPDGTLKWNVELEWFF